MKNANRILLLILFFMCTHLQVYALYTSKADCESYEGAGNCEFCDGRWHRKAACSSLLTFQDELALEKGEPAVVVVQTRNTSGNSPSSFNWVTVICALIGGLVLGFVGSLALKK